MDRQVGGKRLLITAATAAAVIALVQVIQLTPLVAPQGALAQFRPGGSLSGGAYNGVNPGGGGGFNYNSLNNNGIYNNTGVYNNNGYGYGRYAGAYPYGGAQPIYPFGVPYINPVARGNGFYGFNGGGISVNNMWRAPSGYYYPWYGVGGGFNQIIYVDQSGGQNQTIAKDPPLSSMFSDMGAYLDDSKKNNKVSENDYQSLKRRLTDIHSKERSLRIAGGGQLAEGDESEVRQNLNDFSREMVERIKI